MSNTETLFVCLSNKSREILGSRDERINDNGQIFRRAQIKSPGTYEFQGILKFKRFSKGYGKLCGYIKTKRNWRKEMYNLLML